MVWLIGIIIAAGLAMWAFGATLLAAAIMFLGLFVFGSIPFWLLLFAASVGIMWSLSELDTAYIERYYPENPDTLGGGGFATAAICIFGVLTIYSNAHDMPPVGIPLVLAAVILYVIGGILTTFWKWSNYSQDLTKKFIKENDTFFSNRSLSRDKPIPFQYEAEWNRTVGRYAQKPKEYRFMKLKTAWAVYWPWVMIWSLLHDLIARLFETVLSLFNGIFARITDHHWKDVLANMPTFEEAPTTPPDTNRNSHPSHGGNTYDSL